MPIVAIFFFSSASSHRALTISEGGQFILVSRLGPAYQGCFCHFFFLQFKILNRQKEACQSKKI